MGMMPVAMAVGGPEAITYNSRGLCHSSLLGHGEWACWCCWNVCQESDA